MVFITLLVACLVLLISFAVLWSQAARIPSFTSVDLILGEVKAVLCQKFLPSVGIGIPFAASVGVLCFFRFCGSFHRFKIYVDSLRTGSWHVPCPLRKIDDLEDVCDGIHQTINLAWGLRQQVCSVIEEIEDRLDDTLGKRVLRMKEGVAREVAVYDQRFKQPIRVSTSAETEKEEVSG